MNLLFLVIPVVAIIILSAWINSELKINKCWIRITLGSLAILFFWGIAVLAAQIVRLNYNIWYSDATKKLIAVSIEKLEAGEKNLVIERLKKLQEQLHSSYEFKGNYDELVKEAVKNMEKKPALPDDDKKIEKGKESKTAKIK